MNLTLRHVPHFPHFGPLLGATDFITTLRLRQVTFNAELRADIQQAGDRYGLPAALIASVLADEHVRLDGADRVQDKVMRLSLRLPNAGSKLLNFVERLCGRSVDTFSLGHSQMKPVTLAALGRLGYLEIPADRIERRRLLLDNRQAPVLVAACLRATADYWQAGGVNIESRPEVLGTLYSLGLKGPCGVHPHPQANGRGGAIAAHTCWLEERQMFSAVGTLAVLDHPAAEKIPNE
ncbi:TetR/AcrR family transcriptional regulator [Deinococcus saxicola]|uniref:hypothetical protein n=1 Tax=Deinococcus saxicola TaxID=249406 RepID=UPI0039EF544A